MIIATLGRIQSDVLCGLIYVASCLVVTLKPQKA